MALTSPATAPALLSIMGVFGKQLSEKNTFLFGCFILDKQNKATHPSRARPFSIRCNTF